MATPREQAKEQKRKDILAEASRIMADVGFARMRLSDVGAAVGISGPGLYRYFESKEVLLSELLVDISTRLLDGAKAIEARHAELGDGPRALLEDLIAFHVDICVDEPDRIRVQEREHWTIVAVDSEKIRMLQRAYMNLWTDALVQVLPDFDRSTARMRVQLTAGLIGSSRYVHHWANPEVLREQLRVMAWAAILAPA
ncbi:TetR/AcrR family transcriptional regulator [uncultured Corynebacterium sp.]|uniref:TetR/AcrR family transcriptional regulator n=1 Tax=uncultured Corynebacterium sp. TaxID=159447 RepID=UPI0025DAD5DE|nr:TetR/AcrR family transcriptional regulator [uncultured Corynebacterium sp.]